MKVYRYSKTGQNPEKPSETDQVQ